MGRTAAASATRLFCAVLAVLAGSLLLTEQRAAGQRSPSARALERVNGRRAAAREVLVRLRPNAAAGAVAALDLEANEGVGGPVRRLRSRRHSVPELLARLRARPDVLYAEPNYLLHVAGVPNDPYLPDQWAFRAPTAGAAIDAPGAWGVATGSRRFVVGVIDTGVDYTHPDLRANIWSAPTSFSVSIGGETVTCAAGSHGFDAITMSCNPYDSHGHGTRMAGVIGAVGNNAVGVTGVNWAASMMPLKFMNETGTGWTSDALKAMEFAVQVRNRFASTGAADVRVLSNSWGGESDEYPAALEDQIVRAGQHGMLVVAAAGNNGRDTDIKPFYPASLELTNVLSVAATDDIDQLESYSNYGTLTVDIAAPGRAITSTDLYVNDHYSTGSGTSPAAALASGSAALILSHCAVDTETLRTLIVESVDYVPGLAGKTETGGRLNVGRAVRSCSNGNAAPFVDLVEPQDQQRFAVPASIAIAADAYDADGSVTRVDFFVGSTRVGSDTSAPYRFTWTTSTPGTYTLRAMAIDDDGASAETRTSRRIVVENDALPSPWQTRDIGSVGAAGTAYGTGGQFTVEGAGADVWGTADAFRFVYRSMTGDGVVTARVASLETVDAWTKAGVMIRSTLQADAAHAFMIVSPGKGTAFQRRAVAGGTSAHTAGPAAAAPYWVRLERRGQTIVASASANGTAWTAVGQASVALGSTAYVGLAVSSHRSGLPAMAVFDSVSLSQASAAAPLQWTGRDIGSVGAAGSGTGVTGTYTVKGAGADVWGAADAFHFYYTTLASDGEIVARVSTVQNVHAWTKAGVMIRESLQPGSPHAFMIVSPGKGLAFQRRKAADGASTHTTGGSGAAPYWVKLVRRAQTIAAYTSGDGRTWTFVGQDTIAISGSVYIGLAVSSHVTGTTATATFSNVAVR